MTWVERELTATGHKPSKRLYKAARKLMRRDDPLWIRPFVCGLERASDNITNSLEPFDVLSESTTSEKVKAGVACAGNALAMLVCATPIVTQQILEQRAFEKRLLTEAPGAFTGREKTSLFGGRPILAESVESAACTVAMIYRNPPQGFNGK